MRNTLRVSVLVLAFCYPAFAGDIPCPVVAPTPQPAKIAQEAPFDVEIQYSQTPDSSVQDGAIALFEVVLNLLALS